MYIEEVRVSKCNRASRPIELGMTVKNIICRLHLATLHSFAVLQEYMRLHFPPFFSFFVFFKTEK